MKDGLSPAPARTDLTDRELTKIIGGLLGGLTQMTDLQSLRTAVCWWADNDSAWEVLGAAQKANAEMMQRMNSTTGPVSRA